MLSKTLERKDITDKCLQQIGKVNFNHIFSDVKKEKEYLAISKVFKDLSN